MVVDVAADEAVGDDADGECCDDNADGDDQKLDEAVRVERM